MNDLPNDSAGKIELKNFIAAASSAVPQEHEVMIGSLSMIRVGVIWLCS